MRKRKAKRVNALSAAPLPPPPLPLLNYKIERYYFQINPNSDVSDFSNGYITHANYVHDHSVHHLRDTYP